MLTFKPIRSFRVPSAWWRPKPQPETPDLIMTLPPELRNRIYEMYLDSAGAARISQNLAEPALLRVSRTISTEATRLYYGSRPYLFDLSLGHVYEEPFEVQMDIACQMRRLERLVRICGRSPFLRFEFLSRCDACLDLDDLYLLLEMMRKSGFEPEKGYVAGRGRDERARSIASGSDMVHVHSYAHDKKRVLVGRAIAMGRRARDKGWSKLKLEKRFAEFLDLAEQSPRKRRWPAYL